MMPRAEVTALGPVRRMVGFSNKTVEYEGETVADLMRAIETKDGETLYDVLVDDGELRGDYTAFLNEHQLRTKQLNQPLKKDDRLVTMQVIRPVRGGATINQQPSEVGDS